ATFARRKICRVLLSAEDRCASSGNPCRLAHPTPAGAHPMLPANIVCLVALTLFAGLMLWAAASDFRRYLIPNQVSLGALGLFPVYVLSAPAPVQWQWSLAIAAVLFAIAFVMYLLRAFGAGDAKLLPVVVLWVGPKNFTLFILVL